MKFLEGWSKKELAEWFEHPFWRAIQTIIDEQIEYNERDLISGDISVRTDSQEGLLYRSNEQLRGGIVAMNNMRDELVNSVYLALQDAQTQHQNREEGTRND